MMNNVDSNIFFGAALILLVIFVYNLFFGRVFDLPAGIAGGNKSREDNGIWFSYKKFEPFRFWSGVILYIFLTCFLSVIGLLLRFGLIYVK